MDSFHGYFVDIDRFKSPVFLYLTSKGIEAIPKAKAANKKIPIQNVDSDTEPEPDAAGAGG
jgi:hypothetical protein